MRVILTGGGTAGHVFPAINTGEFLKKKQQAELFYIGNKKHIEAKIANEHSIPFYSIQSKGFEGSNAFDRYIKFSVQNAIGVLSAIKIIKNIKPDFIFATGGFVSAPVLMAAKLLKVPFFIHEQNTVLGKVNTLFKKGAQNIFHSFPIAERERSICTGNPVRFKEKLESNGEKVVFIGGSGGSKKLNEAALTFAKNNPFVPIILQTGKRFHERVQMKIENEKLKNITAIDYKTNMIELYREARIIISRCGAGAIFEIVNLSIPNILIPLPTSAENHQKKNGLYVSQQGAGILVEEGMNFYNSLEGNILELWNDSVLRNEMKTEMDKLAIRNSEVLIEKKLLETLKDKEIRK